MASLRVYMFSLRVQGFFKGLGFLGGFVGFI